MLVGRLVPMILAEITVGGIGWELNRRSQSCSTLVVEAGDFLPFRRCSSGAGNISSRTKGT